MLFYTAPITITLQRLLPAFGQLEPILSYKMNLQVKSEQFVTLMSKELDAAPCVTD